MHFLRLSVLLRMVLLVPMAVEALQQLQELEASDSLLQQSFCRGADAEQHAPRDVLPAVRFDPSGEEGDVETLQALSWKGVPSLINMDFLLGPPVDNRTLTVVFHVNGLACVIVHFRPTTTDCGWSFESADYPLGLDGFKDPLGVQLQQNEPGCLARLAVHLLDVGIVPDRGNVYLAEARVVCFRPAGMTSQLQVQVSRMFFRVASSNARAEVMIVVFLEMCHQDTTPAESCIAAVRRLSPQLHQAARVILVSACPAQVAEDAVEDYVDRLSQAVQCDSEECPGILARLYFSASKRFGSYSRTLTTLMHGFDGLVLVLHDSIEYGANYVNSARSTLERAQKESGYEGILVAQKGVILCSQLSGNASYPWSGGEVWLSTGALATLAFFGASAQWDMMERICGVLFLADELRPFYLAFIADMCGVPLILADVDAAAARGVGTILEKEGEEGPYLADEGWRSLHGDTPRVLKACAEVLTDKTLVQHDQYDHNVMSVREFCCWMVER